MGRISSAKQGKFLIGFVVLLVLAICANAWLRPQIAPQDLSTANVRFRDLEKSTGRGGTTYIIHTDDGRSLTMAYNDCFDPARFELEVKPGQPITIQLIMSEDDDTNGTLASLRSGGRSCLEVSCINKNLAQDKIKFPLFGLGAVVMVLLIYRYKKENGFK